METLALVLALALAAETIFIFIYKKKYENKDHEISLFNQQLTDTQSEINRLNAEINVLRQTYEPIINIDEAIQQRREMLFSCEEQVAVVKTDYSEKRAILKSLENEIRIFENKLDDISYGLYAPVYDYDTAAEYKEELESIREDQRLMIKNEKAVHCATEWTVSGSRAEGIRLTKQYAKLLLRAFNGESDSIIARVSWNNIGNMEARIFKAFELVNKLGTTNQSSITSGYLDLKLAELRLGFELQEKLHAEKEEQRLIREQMREEERALKELETAQKKAQDEEDRYQKALVKARQDVETATGQKLDNLTLKIQELEESLAAAQLQKERAMSMAQQTKSGHVYIISNIGSFGENVYKIGMTRRLEPLDRVKELGDASVPFSFDVHGMIYSDNAPELEHYVHRKLADQRLNLLSNRREFFNVNIDQIEKLFTDAGHTIAITKLAEAREFRESQSIRETKALIPVTVDSLFPEALN